MFRMNVSRSSSPNVSFGVAGDLVAFLVPIAPTISDDTISCRVEPEIRSDDDACVVQVPRLNGADLADLFERSLRVDLALIRAVPPHSLAAELDLACASLHALLTGQPEKTRVHGFFDLSAERRRKNIMRLHALLAIYKQELMLDLVEFGVTRIVASERGLHPHG